MNPQDWKDLYSVPSKDSYVHSNAANFEAVLNHNNIFKKGAGDFESKIRPVVIRILEKHVEYWLDLRKQFIAAGMEDGIFTSSDTQKCLEEFNTFYQNGEASFTYLKAFRSMTKVSDKYIKIGRDGGKFTPKKQTRTDWLPVNTFFAGAKLVRDADAYIDLIETSWNEAIDALINVYNQIISENVKLLEFTHVIDVDDAELVKAEPDFNRRFAFAKLNTLIVNMSAGTGGKTGLWGLINLKKLFEGNPSDQTRQEMLIILFDSLGRQNLRGYLATTWSAAIPNIRANLLELGSTALMGSMRTNKEVTKALAKLIGDQDAGTVLKNYTVADTIVFKTKLDIKTGDNLFFGINLKSTQSSRLSRSYNTKEANFLHPAVLKDIKESSGPVQILHWLRANISSLTQFEASQKDTSKNHKSKVKSTIKDNNIFDNFLDLETELSALMLIPRVFDGVFDYQKGVALKNYEKTGSRFHAALINVQKIDKNNDDMRKVNFLWTYDLTNNMIKDLKTKKVTEIIYYNAKPGVKDSKASPIKIEGINESLLSGAWERKKKLYNSFISNGKFISYDILMSDSSLQSIFEEIYRGTSINSPITDIKFSVDFLKIPGGK